MQTNYITNNSFPTSLSYIGEINLSNDHYTISDGGIYNMTCGTDGYYLYFPNPANYVGTRIVISNTGYSDNLGGGIAGTYIPKYGSSNSNVTAIGVGITYNFISDGVNWRLLPLTGVTSIVSDGSVDNNQTITRGGVYSTNPNNDSSPISQRIDVYIPIASALDGETITIFNPSINHYTCRLINANLYNLDNSISFNYTMSANSLLEIVSVGGHWRIVNYQEA
jgi:hypothetical protein